MIAVRTKLALSILLASCAPRAAAPAADEAIPRPPPARVRNVQTDLHAMTVTDPYRWMEDLGSPEFQTWANQQNAYTRATLDRLRVRGELLARLHALSGHRDEVTDVRRRGGRLFYLKRPAAADAFGLYVRDDGERERLVIDPQRVAHERVASIDYYEPSPDGRRIAFGVSANGSEDSILHVAEVDTVALLPDTIDHARHGEPRWLPDGTSLFYRRYQRVAPGAATPAKYQGSRDYLHVLGADPDRDAPVFGYGVSPDVPLAPADSPYVYLWPDCPYVFGLAQHGVSNDLTLYVAPLAALDGPRTPWKPLAGVEDQVLDLAVHGSDAYVVTHRGAPRAKVVRVRLDAPDLAHAETVIAPGETVISELAAASDALYVRALDRGIGRILRVPYDAAAPSPLPLPFDGTIAELVSSPAAPGVSLALSSWTRPRIHQAYDPSRGRFVDLGIDPPAGPVPELESTELEVTSQDGTRVPLSIVHLRGLDRSRPHPTLLEGYGSYGLSISPGFDRRRIAWFERGGIFAVAHIRGGGEYGEEWHQAGMKRNKQNSVDDFVACARFLIERGYTSARQLAVQGISAGGLTVGSAITQQPELFGAALVRVGIVDALRFETAPLGPQNAQEFGTSAIPEELRSLHAMSPYYHVADHARYPAVLLTASAHDPRVPAWQPGK
ncbi:MAG TPA: prolyl oligopeptidase family serine peptidase, partial [Kofleriaceae bacterium]|nr:prolyl oligopeptidase family serine peptidase [Kofleriaceae bacterium]